MRVFICVAGGFLVTALGCAPREVPGGKEDWDARRKVAVDRPRPIVYNTDGCDMLYWPSNLPVCVGNFTGSRLAFALGTYISTVSYCPQSAGFGHFTCRKAGEPFTASTQQAGFYNSAAAFFAMGTDSLQMASEFCATNGLERFVSVRINDNHDSASKPGHLLALYPQFKIDHPECLMGNIDRALNGDLYDGYAGWSAVNFDKELVRETMKRFVRELVENYDVDGIEYDFNRHFMLFRSVAVGGVATAEEIGKMTQLMRDLKEITEEVGRRKGRPIVIAMRSPDSVGYNLAAGVDLETWFREKLVDIWIGGGYFLLNPVDVSVAFAHKYGVKFYWSLDETRIPTLAKKKNNQILAGRMTDAFYAGRYSAAQAAGCDGVYLFNLERESLRRISSMNPADTSAREKIYFAMERGSGGYRPHNWVKDGGRFSNMPMIDPNYPLRLKAGKPYSFEMYFGDDFIEGVQVSAHALTGLKDGRLILKANGRTCPVLSTKDGLFDFRISSRVLHRGANVFEVVFPSDATFNDFSVTIRPSKR